MRREGEGEGEDEGKRAAIVIVAKSRGHCVHYCVQRVAELVKVNRSIIPWKVLLVAACTALQSFPIPTLTPNSHHFRFTTGRNASFPGFPKRPPSRWDHS